MELLEDYLGDEVMLGLVVTVVKTLPEILVEFVLLPCLPSLRLQNVLARRLLGVEWLEIGNSNLEEISPEESLPRSPCEETLLVSRPSRWKNQLSPQSLTKNNNEITKAVKEVKTK